MALFDFEKTSIRLPFVITLMGGLLFVAGGIWRFESNMKELKDSQEALRQEIIYKYTIEIMKINNRIDLIEARKFVQRRCFKRDTLSLVKSLVVIHTKTNNDRGKREKHPQVCMVMPRAPEFQRKRFNIKKLISC